MCHKEKGERHDCRRVLGPPERELCVGALEGGLGFSEGVRLGLGGGRAYDDMPKPCNADEFDGQAL